MAEVYWNGGRWLGWGGFWNFVRENWGIILDEGWGSGFDSFVLKFLFWEEEVDGVCGV